VGSHPGSNVDTQTNRGWQSRSWRAGQPLHRIALTTAALSGEGPPSRPGRVLSLAKRLLENGCVRRSDRCTAVSVTNEQEHQGVTAA
jgi:hypothetical protein